MKYNALKQKWREIKGRPKEDSGIAPEEWLFLLDQVLSDMNTNLEDAVCFHPTNTSCGTRYSGMDK